MGNFYTNYTLRLPSQEAAAAALAGRKAKVTPPLNGCVVAFDEASDDQDLKRISELAARLSGELRCTVLAVLNHDDDILWYQLYKDGNLTDQYDSAPGYFDASELLPPAGGDAELLCAAFGSGDVAAVERVLRKQSCVDGGYVFAFERHADLVRALGLPEYAVGTAYASFEYEEYPEGLSGEDMMDTV